MKLDVQVFRKFGQIQGGKKIDRGHTPVFRGSFFSDAASWANLQKLEHRVKGSL